MISGLLYGLASGSTAVDLGNDTFNLVAALPGGILYIAGALFDSFGS